MFPEYFAVLYGRGLVDDRAAMGTVSGAANAISSAAEVPVGLVVVLFVLLALAVTSATGEAEKCHKAERDARERPQEPPTGDGPHREAGWSWCRAGGRA
jgi:hypothetical protein